MTNLNNTMLEIQIPFGGWYYSHADGMLDTEIEHILYETDNEELRDEIFDNIDFTAVKENVNKDYVEQYLFENGLKGEFSGSISPKFYNYETDKVYAIVTLESLNELKRQAIEENNYFHQDFQNWLIANYSSRSGFISFVKTDLTKWNWDNETDFSLLLEYLEELKGFEYGEMSILETLWSNGSFSLEFKDEELANKHYKLLEGV